MPVAGWAGPPAPPAGPTAGKGAPLGIVRISVTNPPDRESVSVRVCPHGTVVAEGGHVRTKPAQSGGIRGVVTKWSKESRARLRKTLAEMDGEPGTEPIGFNGTIPGPIISESDWRKVWQTFRRYCPPIGVVWRVELQKRKQPHFHIVCWVRSVSRGADKAALMEAWGRAVRRLGEVEWTRKGDPETVYTSSRMGMDGADRHAVKFVELEKGDDFGWWRYLASHTGKSKQDQLGWRGRAWGILNPDKLRRIAGDRHGLTRRQWFKMRRWLRRLTRYRGAGAGCRSVWYVRPDTMKTLVDMARSA